MGALTLWVHVWISVILVCAVCSLSGLTVMACGALCPQ